MNGNLNQSIKKANVLCNLLKLSIQDFTEHGIALIQEFNWSLTHNEEQKQYLLRVVEDHRKKVSAPTKSLAIDIKLQLIVH